jgi:hypothetical protein
MILYIQALTLVLLFFFFFIIFFMTLKCRKIINLHRIKGIMEIIYSNEINVLAMCTLSYKALRLLLVKKIIKKIF